MVYDEASLIFHFSYCFQMSLKSQKKGKDEVRGSIAEFKRKIADIRRRQRYVRTYVCTYICMCMYILYTFTCITYVY